MQKALFRIGTWCRYRAHKRWSTVPLSRHHDSRQLHTTPIVHSKNKSKTSHPYIDITPWNHTKELVGEFTENVLYEDDDVLALTKPNGIPMHELKYTENLSLHIAPPSAAELSVNSCLPGIAHQLNISGLKPVYSQNRLYSGVIILAKHEAAEARLKKYFRHTRAQKVNYQNYLTLTVGLPTDEQADCQVGISRKIIDDWRMSILEPNVSKKGRERGEVIRLQMKHTVLDQNRRYDCALVSLRPTATKWSFLELYLTQQMCAALGDHFYSSRVRSVMGKPVLMHPDSSYPAPQVIPDYVLTALGVPKKSVVDVPAHIHCHQVDLPVRRGRRSSLHTVTAPLPTYFTDSLQRLGLSLPERRGQAEPLSSVGVGHG